MFVHQINCTEKHLYEKLQRKRRKHNTNCKKAENQSNMNEELLQLIEKRLEELQFKKVILERMKTRDAKILNNRMIKEDEGMFYRKTKGKNKRNRKTPKIE